MRIPPIPLTTVHLKPPTVGILLKQITIDKNGCWIWQGYKDSMGYGRISVGYISETPLSVHRLIYAWLVEPLTDDRVIDHFVCQNPSCCNPEHLELVTHVENIMRGRWGENQRKTHCKRGHKLPNPDKNNLRRCRVCINFTRKRREHLKHFQTP